MIERFNAYIEFGKALAKDRKLAWDFNLDENGVGLDGWNLTEAVNAYPPRYYLRDFSSDKETLKFLSSHDSETDIALELKQYILSKPWCDLIKAATCEQLFVKCNKPSSISQSIIRPLKILATCAGNFEPWEIGLPTIQLAIRYASTQPSGKLTDMIIGIVKQIFDLNFLSRITPLYPLIDIQRKKINRLRTAKYQKSQQDILQDLDSRKSSERLPESEAFWELVRIIGTVEPTSYSDKIRFAVLKIMLVTGLRIGEVLTLPFDCIRKREYRLKNGVLAGELGGISSSLMLRYFAEKQTLESASNIVLYENLQYIPEHFAKIIAETIEEVVKLTQPLRRTLKIQCETGRTFINHSNDDLISVNEAYTIISGNPFWLIEDEDEREFWVKKYKLQFDPRVFDAIQISQLKNHELNLNGRMNNSLYVYFTRMFKNAEANGGDLVIRNSKGIPFSGTRRVWNDMFFQVGELEEYLKKNVPTKQSDVKTVSTTTGELHAWERLFLIPKRSLIEERNDGITDVNRFYSIGVADYALINRALGCDESSDNSIFEKYCQTPRTKKLMLHVHSLRHLQGEELNRRGIADTILSKRFNRKNIAQTHEYNHASLLEDLSTKELAGSIEDFLGEKASSVYKMILDGHVTGPIVDKFKGIQVKYVMV